MKTQSQAAQGQQERLANVSLAVKSHPIRNELELSRQKGSSGFVEVSTFGILRSA
jgi:hypothetical protein